MSDGASITSTRHPVTGRLNVVLLRRAHRVLETLRRHRRLVSLGALGLAAALSYGLAFWLRFDLTWPGQYDQVFLLSLGILIAVRVGSAYAVGLDTHRWRFVGLRDMRRLGLAVAAGTIVFLAMMPLVDPSPAIPLAVFAMEPILTVLLAAGLWTSYRTAYEVAKRSHGFEEGARRVLVVGAGRAGESLVRQMLFHPGRYRPVAFADDDVARHGTSIHGVKVMGDTTELVRIVERCRAHEIVIALPSAGPSVLRRIVELCEPTGLPFRVLPHIAEVLEGDVSLSQLREIQVEDLLGREPVALELPELTRELTDKTVLITGAAGSIGSELSRQVARNRPAELVLLDQSETGLFFLELELKELAPDVEIRCIVGDVVDAGTVEHAFRRYGPHYVYHAAAYKHVPMMETNEREALRNNVIGTWRVANAAGRHGAQKFVLVSTDKAVRPANVMGASKRVAEIVVLELQNAYPRTAFGAVRFGNVLGSAGSVVPIFKQLLEAGKPLTVTHRDVTRYFMTIPEASQLVLQASLLPELRGRIAMLDMGQPIRILDLARTLIRLSGGRREQEPIVFTGLRPGEKLHEELVAPEEKAFSTRIPKVHVLEPDGTAFRHGLLRRLEDWERLLQEWILGPVMEEVLTLVPALGQARGATTTPPELEVERKPRRAPASLLINYPTRRPAPAPTIRYPHPYPYGKPGFIDRRHPSNRPADMSQVPRRRATDFQPDLWSAPSA